MLSGEGAQKFALANGFKKENLLTPSAKAAWQNWLKAHPTDARANTLIGTLEETKGDVNKAMDSYKKALQLDSGQAVAANNLAYLMVVFRYYCAILRDTDGQRHWQQRSTKRHTPALDTSSLGPFPPPC